MPNADRRAMEDELVMMYEDLASQAETLAAMVNRMDDDGSDGGSVRDWPNGVIGLSGSP